MRVVVPYAVQSPKTRLSPALHEAERTELSRAMLADVLDAISETGPTPEVLATAPIDLAVPVTVDDRPLTPAVNAILRDGVPVAVVMADLALATPVEIAALLDAPGELVIAPGRAGGTNAFVSRHPDFRVDYHGTSYLDHLAVARRIGASVYPIDSHRLSTDIDERADLVELLIHGEGRAHDWLVDAGFELDTSGDRVRALRR